MLIVEFEWDDEVEEHLARHGLSLLDLDAMLAHGAIAYRRNKKAAGQYRLQGRGCGGRHIVVIVRRTSRVGCWRPVTGWPL